MGYNTDLGFELELRDKTIVDQKISVFKIKTKAILDELASATDDNWDGFTITEEGTLTTANYSGKYYDVDQAIVVLAKHFNGFIRGDGEDSDDKWKYEMQDGKVKAFTWEWVEKK